VDCPHLTWEVLSKTTNSAGTKARGMRASANRQRFGARSAHASESQVKLALEEACRSCGDPVVGKVEAKVTPL
jgi:hypothetical protein